VLFAVAQSIGWLGAGRFLMGLGSAFAYIGTIYVASAWFPARRIALIAGLTAALGMAGAIAGQVVAGLVLEVMPWRDAMLILAGIGVALAGLMWLFIPNRPAYLTARIRAASTANGGSVFAGLRHVMRSKANWLLAAAVALLYLPVDVFASMWGDRYLEHVLKMSPESAQWADALVFLGLGLSAPLMGWWTDRSGRRLGAMRLSASVAFVALMLQFYVVDVDTAVWSFPVLFALGLGSGGVILGFAVAIDQNADHARGAALAFVNCAQMGLVFAGEWLVGVLLDTFAGSNDVLELSRSDFQKAFAILPLSVLLSVGLMFMLRHRAHVGHRCPKNAITH
jgi:MFS family permease